MMLRDVDALRHRCNQKAVRIRSASDFGITSRASAAPEKVYRAFLDPEAMAKWQGA